MEPLTSAIGATGVVRLSPATTADLSTLFKDGRVVAGEVLETFAGGSVVLGIAGQRVPAQSHADLEPGQRFLATVEHTDGQIVLRIASDDLGETSPLVRALRLVVGQELASGSILDGLKSFAGQASARSPAFAALLADITSHAFAPAEGGEAMRELLLRSGLRYESALRAAAEGDHGSAWLRSAVVGEIAARLSAAAPEVTASALRSEIATLLLDTIRAPAIGADLASATALGDWLRRVFDARSPSGSMARSRAVLERALAHLEGSPAGADAAALLRWLFGAPPDDRALSLLKEVAQRALGRDLKARLLVAQSELEPGPAREGVQRALASLETDQLMNAARRRFDQAWHFSVPVPDGEHWASAQFLHLPSRDHETRGDEREGESEQTSAAQRLMIGIDLSRLGPIRADVLLRQHDLIVRLTVERPETAAALRGLVESWRADFAVGGRAVHVAVTESTDVDVKLHAVASDVRFLAENHLMDVSG